jgi:ABC-2 type transport system permease protein
MKQWWVMFRREWLEMWRSYKVIWMPIAFVLLGISQPVTSYYLPDILKNFGELPEGSVIEIPVPSAADVLASTLSGQFTQVGMLILVLASMGLIASERSSGIASIILVKPVSYWSYVTAKWTGALCLTWLSYGLGYLAAWYYTTYLFGTLPLEHAVQAFFLYGLWLSFITTITTALSTCLKNTGAVAAVSLMTVVALAASTSMVPEWLGWSPARHMNHSVMLLTEGQIGDQFVWSLLVTGLLLIGFMVAAVLVFRKKELH